MALTQIKTDAISDDAVTGAKIADDTVAEANMANDAISLAEIKAGTDGQILTFDASGNPTYVGPGTDGQVLTSTGVGSPPAFEAAAAGVGGATAVTFNDNVKANWGTGADFQIWSTGTDSIIRHTNSGSGEDLILESDTATIIGKTSVNGGDVGVKFIADGAVELYHNNIKKFETTTDGVTVTGDITFTGNVYGGDSDKIRLGADQDLEIYHDGVSKLVDTSGNLHIGTNSFILKRQGLDETMLTATANGAVELYYDNALQVKTTSTGITLGDSKRIDFGADADLKVYSTGSAGYIINSTGDLNLRTGGTLWIDNVGGTATYAKITESGSVELYYNGAKHFETTSGGARVSGKFYTEANEANGWVGHFTHEGNSNDRYGVLVYCGTDDASGTNYGMIIADGDGGTQGSITFTGGTCSYNAFTASHWCIIPSVDNPSNSSMAYAYGTLLETVSIGYTQKDDANTERGILYTVQKTQTANSKKILGTYAGSLNGGPDNHTNMHEVNVLGDGHILCNNSGGNISVGDGICSSSTAGIGQKATASPSMIIGIAQEDVTFTGTETKLVPVQFGLQQFTPW